jgi:glycosyltransferase involved in cell wall biosynthesis
LNQTFSDFDFIILNDNSTDTTEAIILAAQKEDSRIILIDKENIGPAYLSEGINLANTLYVALMDADDISLPTRFEKQIKVLDENPHIGLCATWFTF